MSAHLEAPIYDPDLFISDFEKMWEWPLIHLCMRTYHTFCTLNGSPPKPWDETDAQKFADIAIQDFAKYEIEADDKTTGYVKKFANVATGVFSPLTAYLGGIVA